MKQILLVITLCFIAISTQAQSKDLTKAINDGKNSAMQYKASFTKTYNKSKIESWLEGKGYVVLGFEKEKIARFGGYEDAITSVTFISKADHSHLADLQRQADDKLKKTFAVQNGIGRKYVSWSLRGYWKGYETKDIKDLDDSWMQYKVYKGMLKDGQPHGKGNLTTLDGRVFNVNQKVFYHGTPMDKGDYSKFEVSSDGEFLLKTQEGVLFEDNLELINHFTSKTYWTGQKESNNYASGEGKLTVNSYSMGELIIYEGTVKNGRLFNGVCYVDPTENKGYIIKDGRKSEYFDDSPSLAELLSRIDFGSDSSSDYSSSDTDNSAGSSDSKPDCVESVKENFETNCCYAGERHMLYKVKCGSGSEKDFFYCPKENENMVFDAKRAGYYTRDWAGKTLLDRDKEKALQKLCDCN